MSLQKKERENIGMKSHSKMERILATLWGIYGYYKALEEYIDQTTSDVTTKNDYYGLKRV